MNPNMELNQYWFAAYGPLVNKKNQEKLAEYQNNLEYQILFNKYLNLKIDEFEWLNLPKTCSSEFIEKNLVWWGKAALNLDDDEVIRDYGAGIGGKLTRHGKPSEGFLYTFDGKNKRARFYWEDMDNTGATAVLIEDNPQGIPPINEIMNGAYMVSDAKRTVETASRHFKVPYIIVCSPEQAESVKKIYNDVANNKPLILINKGNDISEEQTQVMTTQLQSSLLKELWDYYKNTEDDLLKNIGVQVNQNNDKKERMTEVEVKGDVDYLDVIRGYRLEQRKKACKLINEAFGLNVDVRFKHETEKVEEKKEYNNKMNDKEEEENV